MIFLKLGLFKTETLCYSMTCAVVWLSLVERYIRDVEVAGSNPVASINRNSNMEFRFFSFVMLKYMQARSIIIIKEMKGYGISWKLGIMK